MQKCHLISQYIPCDVWYFLRIIANWISFFNLRKSNGKSVSFKVIPRCHKDYFSYLIIWANLLKIYNFFSPFPFFRWMRVTSICMRIKVKLDLSLIDLAEGYFRFKFLKKKMNISWKNITFFPFPFFRWIRVTSICMRIKVKLDLNLDSNTWKKRWTFLEKIQLFFAISFF